jgi:hypothetical protein
MDMVIFLIECGAEGTRTPDLLRAKEALSQLSYSPICSRYYSNKRSYSQFDLMVCKMPVIISVALEREKAK